MSAAPKGRDILAQGTQAVKNCGSAACCAEGLSPSDTAGSKLKYLGSAASRKAAGFPHKPAAEPQLPTTNDFSHLPSVP